MLRGQQVSMIVSCKCFLVFAQLDSRLFAICRRKTWRLQSLPLRLHRFFNLVGSEICRREYGQVGRVLHVEGNGVVDERNCFCGVAVRSV